MTHYNRTLRELHQEPLLGNRTIANSLCVLLTTPEVHRLATLPLLTMMTRIMDNSFQKLIVGKLQIMQEITPPHLILKMRVMTTMTKKTWKELTNKILRFTSPQAIYEEQ